MASGGKRDGAERRRQLDFLACEWVGSLCKSMADQLAYDAAEAKLPRYRELKAARARLAEPGIDRNKIISGIRSLKFDSLPTRRRRIPIKRLRDGKAGIIHRGGGADRQREIRAAH